MVTGSLKVCRVSSCRNICKVLLLFKGILLVLYPSPSTMMVVVYEGAFRVKRPALSDKVAEKFSTLTRAPVIVLRVAASIIVPVTLTPFLLISITLLLAVLSCAYNEPPTGARHPNTITAVSHFLLFSIVLV